MQQQETNVAGVIGFCLMILGYMTCGILSIPAAVVSGVGMYREPKGLAIAGFLLSLPAAFGVILVCILFVAGVSIPILSPSDKPIPSVEEQLEKIQAERASQTPN